MKRGEGVCQDEHDELEGRLITRGCRSCYIAELVTALNGIVEFIENFVPMTDRRGGLLPHAEDWSDYRHDAYRLIAKAKSKE
jgi:hypothetical protein